MSLEYLACRGQSQHEIWWRRGVGRKVGLLWGSEDEP